MELSALIFINFERNLDNLILVQTTLGKWFTSKPHGGKVKISLTTEDKVYLTLILTSYRQY